MANTRIKIKKGDSVQVLAGKDSGKRGTVLRVLPGERRVVVEKVNMIKRHTKPRPAPRSSGVGHRVNEDGVKVRVCRNCGKDVDR